MSEILANRCAGQRARRSPETRRQCGTSRCRTPRERGDICKEASRSGSSRLGEFEKSLHMDVASVALATI